VVFDIFFWISLILHSSFQRFVRIPQFVLYPLLVYHSACPFERSSTIRSGANAQHQLILLNTLLPPLDSGHVEDRITADSRSLSSSA
jgi:hypothetical protein